MPIRPEFKWLYPLDWPQLSAVIRFERAKGRCEICGRPHGQQVRHLGDGRWFDEELQTCQRALNTPHNGALKIPWIPDAAASPEPVSGRR